MRMHAFVKLLIVGILNIGLSSFRLQLITLFLGDDLWVWQRGSARINCCLGCCGLPGATCILVDEVE